MSSKTYEELVAMAKERGWKNPEGWARGAFAKNAADDEIFFRGSYDQLVALGAKRKHKNPAVYAAEVLAKRAQLQEERGSATQVDIYQTGNFDQLVAYLEATPIKQADGSKQLLPDLESRERYARGILRKRCQAIFDAGTREELVIACKDILKINNAEAYADKVMSGRVEIGSTGQ